MPGAPTAWLPYVHVTSADQIVEKATRLGARVVMTATDIPTIGRIAIFLDPQGVGLGILQPTT
jgi:predicted enzyme related to lactoylglutathione lyase